MQMLPSNLNYPNFSAGSLVVWIIDQHALYHVYYRRIWDNFQQLKILVMEIFDSGKFRKVQPFANFIMSENLHV